LTYVNTQPSGSQSESSASLITATRQPDIAFAVIPEVLSTYDGNQALMATTSTIPSDIFEYPGAMKVQVCNATGQGVSKMFTIPTHTIHQDTISPGGFQVIPNAWNRANNYNLLNWSVLIGWETFPRVINNGVLTVAPSMVATGVLRVETVVEFAVPIKVIAT